MYINAFYQDENHTHMVKPGSENLKHGLKKKGYDFYFASPTNQQFVILNNEQMQSLSQKASFDFWEKRDADHTIVRFATSWATSEEDVEQFLSTI